MVLNFYMLQGVKVTGANPSAKAFKDEIQRPIAQEIMEGTEGVYRVDNGGRRDGCLQVVLHKSNQTCPMRPPKAQPRPNGRNER